MLPGPVHATNRAHVHGQGQLDLAIDHDLVTIELELPLEAVVGFERAPRNERERKAVAGQRSPLLTPAKPVLSW
ncbi:DUF2796 domain-containing protein [Accumulibacter sp.]|uniref:ZrgA family zinc uptake protein n=1 Tax=Accumulibacter sp. TaxID=2053492 RepID=UPI0025D0C1BF|nr:DUF2796 domain-containing protein [Accumulibacter sp.]MCM8594809.1 DUF2796 domain-containing protein [Accumulibacter sp.]MCM8625086.1 DUF2796 domain-containing protein [Accumulibacter sp.]MDS4048954.1 DUF2796 domain-containing protein [Accumulibacter sp.]